MVVPTDTDFTVSLSAPYERLTKLFSQTDPQASDQERVQAVAQAFRSTFDTRARLVKIPTLPSLVAHPTPTTSQNSATPCLVRWRCMVQQTAASSEMFVRSVPDGVPGSGFFGAADWSATVEHSTPDTQAHPHLHAHVQPEYTNLAERNVLFGVSIPGETSWEADMWGYDDHSTTLSPPPTGGVLSQKTPLNDKGSIAVLLKLYDAQLADSIRVTDVVEVVGVLGYERYAGGSDFDAPVVDAPMVPVIHAVFLAQTPLTVSPSSKPCTVSSTLPPAEIEQAVVSYLSTALEGDHLAAQLVWYALLARARGQRAGMTLGALSLNVSHLPSGSSIPSKLSHALTQLVPALVHQPLSIEALNKQRWYPSSDDGDMLRSGRLQLAKGSTLLIDETQLDEGTLKDTGVRNVRSLTTLLQTHKLGYAFPFNEYEFDTDLSTIVLSSTKSMLPTDLCLPWSPTAASPATTTTTSTSISTTTTAAAAAASTAQPTTDQLQSWRAHLLQARLAALPALPEPLAKQITEEFVDSRRVTTQASTQDDLQRRLNLTRLAALGRGAELDEQLWRSIVQLDEQVQARLV